MAGGSPLCLAGRWLVDWFWQRDWQNVADCWLVGGLVLCDVKIETQMTDLSWLTAWLAAPLFAELVGGWLIGFGKETDIMFGWLLVGGWLGNFYCKIETNNWLTCLDQLTDCMDGGSPPCLAGRWLVNWFWQRDWQNVGWLLVGGLLGVFEFKIETKMTDLSWLTAWLAAPLFA